MVPGDAWWYLVMSRTWDHGTCWRCIVHLVVWRKRRRRRAPGQESRARGTESPTPMGMSVLQQRGDVSPVRLPLPPQSPGQPGGGRATPAKGPEGPPRGSGGKREDRGMPGCLSAEGLLSEIPPAPVLPGLQPFNPLPARALPREMSRELGRCWVPPNWGRTPQTVGFPACQCLRGGIFQA